MYERFVFNINFQNFTLRFLCKYYFINIVQAFSAKFAMWFYLTYISHCLVLFNSIRFKKYTKSTTVLLIETMIYVTSIFFKHIVLLPNVDASIVFSVFMFNLESF